MNSNQPSFPVARPQGSPITTGIPKKPKYDGITKNGHAVSLLPDSDISQQLLQYAECAPCLNVYESTYNANCGSQHTLCKRCFIRSSKLPEKNICHSCKKDFITVEPTRATNNLLAGVTAACLHCDVKEAFEKMDDHMRTTHPSVKPEEEIPSLPKTDAQSSSEARARSPEPGFAPTAPISPPRPVNHDLPSRWRPPFLQPPGGRLPPFLQPYGDPFLSPVPDPSPFSGSPYGPGLATPRPRYDPVRPPGFSPEVPWPDPDGLDPDGLDPDGLSPGYRWQNPHFDHQ